MMAARKSFLDGYKIGGDLIDRITAEKQSCEGNVVLENAATDPPTVADIVNAVSPQPSSAELPLPAGAKQAEDKVIPFPGTVLGETLVEYPLEHSKDGLFEVFTIGDLTYRLGGVKPLFVTSLRVNVRVGNGTQNYYDGLDLYLARSRTAFSQAAERALGAEGARVERDLVRILERLETERDRQLSRKGEKVATAMSAEEQQAGMELLCDKNIFTRIVDDLSALGYVGEDLNKQLLYLCATSRKRDNTLSVLILSQSASGKSYLVDCVRRLMPEDEVIAVTSLSDQALNYLTDMEHKFLILGEAVHSEAVEHQIREMLSGKELSRLVVEKDPESGRMESRMMKMKVVVSSVMGSTAGKVNPENASRCFVIHADESRQQTERIHEYQRKRKSLEYLSSGSGRVKEIIKTHTAAQRLLRNIPVINDFASLLDFPTSLMRSRRDHERFLDLIDAVCFLRQYQKKEEKHNGVVFIRCDITDYEIAYNIMVNGVLSSTLEELPKGARLLYEQVRDWVRGEAKKRKVNINELRFTQRQVREATGLGHSWTAAMLRVLVEWEYLEQISGGGQRSKAWYSMRSDEGILLSDLSMIPAPETLNAFFSKK
jgi:energy-coupling factor transporter ATP-binding protein EcfA2